MSLELATVPISHYGSCPKRTTSVRKTLFYPATLLRQLTFFWHFIENNHGFLGKVADWFSI